VKLDLSIDTLVLEGLEDGAWDRDAIVGALQRELGHLLASGGALPRQGFSVERVRGAPLVGPADSSAGLGQRLAGAVYAELQPVRADAPKATRPAR
jgi:hypothetical protein